MSIIEYNPTVRRTEENDVKLCLDDILETLDSISPVYNYGTPTSSLKIKSHHGDIPGGYFHFSKDNLLRVYLVNSKEAELHRESPLPEGVICEYCGESDQHISDIRGGGGVDEMCVVCTGQGEGPQAFFSCVSCCEKEDGPHERYGLCSSCGVHNNLLGNEEETMVSHDHLNYRELDLPFEISADIVVWTPRIRGFCPHCIDFWTNDALVDIVVSRERHEDLPPSIAGMTQVEPGEIVEATVVETPNVRRRLDFSDSDEEVCISCRVPNPRFSENLSVNTFTYHRASSGDRMLPYCPSCEIEHEAIVQDVRLAEEYGIIWDSEDLELTDDEDYEGEYENEDLPENNTEKAKEIKDAVKDVGEKIFDIQDQLKEGDYLEIMNLLQKVTNKVNGL